MVRLIPLVEFLRRDREVMEVHRALQPSPTLPRGPEETGCSARWESTDLRQDVVAALLDYVLAAVS